MGLQGFRHVPQDMASCYERSRPNLERLAKALKPNHSTLRGTPAGLPFHFDSETIARGLNKANKARESPTACLAQKPFQLCTRICLSIAVFHDDRGLK